VGVDHQIDGDMRGQFAQQRQGLFHFCSRLG
jgi:hypothetical protein